MARDPYRDVENAAVNAAMRSPGLAVAVIVGAIALACGYYLGRHGMPAAIAPAGGAQDNISVHFSPNGGCTDAVVAEIRDANQSIHVQAYSFSSKEIVRALIDAANRGVKVTIVADEKASREEYSKTGECGRAGIPVFTDGAHPIAHNKIMLIDGRTIITGSFNFTAQAEHGNGENLLVMRDKADLYGAYERNFQAHLAHSTPYGDSMVKEKRGR
jgi:phosphatidylserine/phosphatidylglycerophosphate/cardiolipin synthase-like enzyme